MVLASQREPVVYPESDGKPTADNIKQFRWIVTIEGGIESLFHDREDVFVAGNLFWYPVKDHPEIRMAPDVMVVFGRPMIDPVDGWVSPRLGVRFERVGGELRIIRPDGQPFLTYAQMEAERRRAQQRAERLAQRLRELGIDPEQIEPREEG